MVVVVVVVVLVVVVSVEWGVCEQDPAYVSGWWCCWCLGGANHFVLCVTSKNGTLEANVQRPECQRTLPKQYFIPVYAGKNSPGKIFPCCV